MPIITPSTHTHHLHPFFSLAVLYCSSSASLVDTVKTRMQLNTGKSQFGMVGMLKDIVAKEGVARLYRGILAPFAMEAPKRATKCE